MSIIQDEEFGKVTVRRNARSSHIRLRVAPDGTLRASAPTYTPMFVIKRMINSSRKELRVMLHESRPLLSYNDGSEIGKSHSLRLRQGEKLSATRHGLQIILTLPADMELADPEAQELLRSHVIKALRREAKGYLPRRLQYLADQHGFTFNKVRLSHAAGRWGSCSSTGTISLNIALMKLPLELIDYVIIHELAHTKHMNHSKEFWTTVERYDPHYLSHRKRLKQEAPSV